MKGLRIILLTCLHNYRIIGLMIEEIVMSKMKSWMMDMEEAVVDCIENGASSMSDVLAGVRTAVPICDDKFVMEYVKTIMGPDEAD